MSSTLTKQTKRSTKAATVAPTVAATSAPTVVATVAPTVAPTVAATVATTVAAPKQTKKTKASTVAATVAATGAAPTVAPTVAATVAPTVAATVATTTATPTAAPAVKTTKRAKKVAAVSTPVSAPEVSATSAAPATETATETQTGGEDQKKFKRYFRIVQEGNTCGRVQGNKPKQAANKAFSSLCRKFSNPEEIVGKEQVFSIQECTRGSNQQVYTYKGLKVALAPENYIKVERKVSVPQSDGSVKDEVKVVCYKFKNQLHKVTKKQQTPVQQEVSAATSA